MQLAAKHRRETMLTIFWAVCVLGFCAVRADPTTVAYPDAVMSAAMLCPVSAGQMSNTLQLATDLQPATIGPVLTCSSNSRSAFLDAVALPQPSGSPGDADIVPSLVIQPAGTQADAGATCSSTLDATVLIRVRRGLTMP